MANQEHVDRLKQGVKAWNTWREENLDIWPDLSGANLNGAQLSAVNLSRTNLSGVNLSGANLHFANINRANLSKANLIGTDLNRSELLTTNLGSADLSGADLRFADLMNTNLSEANFTYVRLRYTTFADVDLSHVKGLETAIHEARSIVDINSVTFPLDEPTRRHFLLGVGFTETQIDYLPSLLTPLALQYHSLFISYAHQDEAVAKQLYTDLRKNDVPCWFAPHDLKIGEKLRPRIDESIHLHEKLLLILSEHSLVSQWVEHEVETALGKERKDQSNVLFPIRLDNAVLKSTTGWASHIRLTRHIGEFTNWQDDAAYQKAFTRLLQDLKVDRPPMK